MEKLVAILLMGGSSSRFGGPKNKLLCELNGKPVFSYSLDVFASLKEFDNIYIAVNPEIRKEVETYIKEKGINATLFDGGETREQSVWNVLVKTYPNEYIVVVHDAARPLIDKDIIFRLLDGLKSEPNICGATTAIPVTDTLAMVDQGYAVKFPDRSRFVQVQTPQAFFGGLLWEAHYLKDKDVIATDDCSLMLEQGRDIKVVEGSKKLHKVTTIEDIKYLEGLLK